MPNKTPPSFSPQERSHLLQAKGVGPTVIKRLEEMGITSLHQLSQAKAEDILQMGAHLTQSSCWKNSPQARAAIQSAISLAQNQVQPHGRPLNA